MTEVNKQDFWNRKTPSVFFPLLLIAVGVVLLLKTLGLLEGNLWDMFLKAWPVFLIAGGLDSIYRREGIVGGVAWAGLGIIVLMANLGYIAPMYWNIVLRIWPFALVIWGLDILLSRHNWWSAALSLVIGVVLVGLIYWVSMAAPVTRVTHSETFEVPLKDAKQATIEMESITGKFFLQDGAGLKNLADGDVELLTDEDLALDYDVHDNTGYLSMKNDMGDDSQYWFPNNGNNRKWRVNLAENIPLDITSKMVVGEQTADLSGLLLDDAEIETVMGRSVITLPEEWTGTVSFEVALGDMVIYVPEGLAVSFNLDTAITALDYPHDFERTEDTLRSPGGEAAGALQVNLSLPIGSVRIEYVE